MLLIIFLNFFKIFVKFRRSKNPFKKNKDVKLTDPLKYTAAKLHEKGVILDIEGVQPNQ
jgi:hypothetical protein